MLGIAAFKTNLFSLLDDANPGLESVGERRELAAFLVLLLLLRRDGLEEDWVLDTRACR